jgi:3-oxoacyl-[acyl-carrier-protein] synthase-3
VLSNTDLEKFVETNDEWISTRTGIKRRHVLADGESMAGHAAEACRKAMDMASVSAADISMVIMATSTPDDVFGSACQVCRCEGLSQALERDANSSAM